VQVEVEEVFVVEYQHDKLIVDTDCDYTGCSVSAHRMMIPGSLMEMVVLELQNTI
jgi:hypothetical protein